MSTYSQASFKMYFWQFYYRSIRDDVTFKDLVSFQNFPDLEIWKKSRRLWKPC